MLFKFKQSPNQAMLGKLERKVMDDLWQRGESSVTDVHRSFGEQLAYTTLMTTLDRLFRKGFLTRRKEGRAFLYTPRFSRDGLEREIQNSLIERLFGGSTVEPILSCIVDKVSDCDRALLDELDRLVQEKREALNSSE